MELQRNYIIATIIDWKCIASKKNRLAQDPIN